MFRSQIHVQIRPGHWREYLNLYEKTEELVRAKNLVPSQLWAVSFGQVNAVVIVQDYETIEAFDRDVKAFEKDAELEKLWRDGVEHTDGIPWTELWESAHQIA